MIDSVDFSFKGIDPEISRDRNESELVGLVRVRGKDDGVGEVGNISSTFSTDTKNEKIGALTGRVEGLLR